jgi:predicted SAM-dependent methyltransferase
VAFELAKVYDPDTKFFFGSILDMPFNNDVYDAVYCFNTLHLFLKENRFKFLRNCFTQLKDHGFIFFTVFSEKENSYGKGKRLEYNTFESKPGRPTHYFTEADLIEHFENFRVIETGLMKDKENHGILGPHIHILRYIFAQKT